MAEHDENDKWVGDDRFAHIIAEELANAEPLAAETDVRVGEAYGPADDDAFGTPKANDKRYMAAFQRRLELYQHIANGMSIYAACDEVGIGYQTYKKYRRDNKGWAAKIDVVRQAVATGKPEALTLQGPAAHIARWFGQVPTWFQLMFLNELDNTPNGNILMALWPPEHGKTTTFENAASLKLAMEPGWRYLVSSENQGIAKKILGRVMNRMDPLGPFPEFVSHFGPFVPQSGGGMNTLRQPWTDTKFRVYKAKGSDERNYSMEAVGVKGSIVSARTDHLHVDDPQSTKTLTQTESITTWFRQDALSRPAESGITSVVGTRVGEEDFFAELLDDGNLDDIMKVIRYPAIVTEHETGTQKPLWEKAKKPDGTYDMDSPGHTMESLDRMRRKVGDDIWDRNWMQNPGISRKGKGTFTTSLVEKCLDPFRSLEHHVGDEGQREDGMVYIGLDPALGSKNCIVACEIVPKEKGSDMIVRRIREDVGFERNEQIMDALLSVVRWCNMTGLVTDVVIEDKNFQKGLMNDERLQEMSEEYGFNIRGHTTGWNKYDDDLGVASMATSFIKGEIILPWAEDDMTRNEIGELKRQLYAWKPGARGNRLRQDRVMALWFVWSLWRSRRKSLEGLGSTAGEGFKRKTMPWTVNRSGLLIPNRSVA